MCSQGTQESGYFDEQPSERHVYPHSIPAVYARYADKICVSGKIKFETPYCIKQNELYESIECTNEDIDLKHS